MGWKRLNRQKPPLSVRIALLVKNGQWVSRGLSQPIDAGCTVKKKKAIVGLGLVLGLIVG